MDFPSGADGRLSEVTFHLIVESSPNALLLVDGQGLIVYVNRQCERLFGREAAEFIGQPVEMLMPERFRGGHVALRERFMRAPSLRDMADAFDLYALRKDGSEVPVEIELNPLVLPDGVRVLATIVDATHRRQANERFRQVVQSAPNAMILFDPMGHVAMANRQAAALFGFGEPKDMLGLVVETFLPKGLHARHVGLRNGFFANPQTRYMGVGRELTARRQDGTEVPVEVGLNPIRIEEGVMVLASIIDISERKAKEEMRTKKEAAEAAYKAKGELLAIASHDLKNPLAAIAGLSEILLELKKAEPSPQQPDIEYLESIFEASRHMSEVVKGILANEGLEQQGLAQFESVDLGRLCEGLIQFNEPVAARKQIAVLREIEPGLVVHGDPTRLREAFDNYLSNAIKYSPPGRQVTVRLAKLDGRNLVEFGVRDQGPGLTADDQAKLFGKFKRLSAKPTAGEPSTGLGLSIVKSIVELHRGSVGCDSEVGHGAYFWARLPLV